MTQWLRGIIYYCAGWLEVACVFILAGAMWAKNTEPSYHEMEAWKSVLLSTLREWSGSLQVNVPAIVVIAFGLRRALGPPWAATVVHELLNTYREIAFGDEDGPVDEHRVTLFRVAQWYTPWRFFRGQHLKFYARSGHTTQRSKTWFRIPDDAGKREGVAGQAWSRSRKCVSVSGLPDLTAEGVTDSDFFQYAKATWVPKGWLKRREPEKRIARSFLSLPVELDGRTWGVIVVDSRSEKALAIEVVDSYAKIGATLSSVIKEAAI